MMFRFAVRRVLCAVSFVALPWSVCCAQSDPNWAQKMFAESRHDFGDVAKGASVNYRLKLTNLYLETVHIANVRTSCGCTSAKASKDLLQSRQEAYIDISLDTVKHSRKKESNVIITFDQPQAAEVRIPITAYIRTDVVITPGMVNFGAIQAGSKQTKKVTIAYAGRPEWKIRGVKPTSAETEVTLVETSRANGQVTYDLDVALKSDLPKGDFRSQILLETDDAAAAPIPLLVEAHVESEFTISPDPLPLGKIAAGKTQAYNVVVKGQKPFGIEKLECDSETPAFKVRLPKDEKLVHLVPLTFTAPAKEGDFTETFTITIAGRPQPLTFKAYGTIIPASN